MTSPTFFRLDRLSVIDVAGDDAMTILHNLTTNDVKQLAEGQGCETFVTDVRGKTLGHVCLYRTGSIVRMIGAEGQSDRIAAHTDRYTIREDATPTILDDQRSAFVLDEAAIDQLGIDLPAEGALAAKSDRGADVYQVRWLGDRSAVLLCEPDEAEAIADSLKMAGLESADAKAFHDRRVLHAFPWIGVDLDESNLPQEADRDAAAISFTKGCYLGQETVARLDALGQVQKKLVRWSIAGGVPSSGMTLESDEKKVGRITSVGGVGDSGDLLALGFARRSHFDPGSTAHGLLEDGSEIVATVR